MIARLLVLAGYGASAGFLIAITVLLLRHDSDAATLTGACAGALLGCLLHFATRPWQP